jgi:hypothetical protein
MVKKKDNDHFLRQQIPQFRIFLASPGDVDEERNHVRSVIEQLRGERAFRGRIGLECIAWDQPGVAVPMEAVLTPQKAIMQGMPKPSDCDLVLIILWSRIGTPLPSDYLKSDGTRYLSGTEWEYQDAITAFHEKGRPQIWLYQRNQEPGMSADDPDYEEKQSQLKLVNSFFDSLVNKDGSIAGGINQYSTPDEFRKSFEHHLRDLLTRELENLKDTVELVVKPVDRKSYNSKKLYSLIALLLSVLAIVATVSTQEIRTWLGLKSPPVVIRQETIKQKTETIKNDTSKITIPKISEPGKIKQENKKTEPATHQASKVSTPAKKPTNLSKLYIANTSFLNKTQSTEIVVVIIDNDKINYEISHKIAALLKKEGFNATASFFNSNFVSDKMFNKLLEGNSSIIKELKLSKYMDYLLIGSKTTSFINNPDLQNLITANTSLSINKLSTSLAMIEDSFVLKANGAGFVNNKAENMAVDRICKQFSEKIKKM